METKEVKIDIPKGYEIDKENSTFECIKFKPKSSKKYITYEDVCKSLFPNSRGYYITTYGEIVENPLLESLRNANNAPCEIQLKKLLALNQLMNIAYYYNGKQYIKVGCYIGYDKLQDIYFVGDLDNEFTQAAEMTPLFMFTKDAKAVIDNPNFRSILDTLCK